MIRPITYEDYEIIAPSNGFEKYSVEKAGDATMDKFALGTRAKFTVKKGATVMSFVFAVSALDAMDQPHNPKFQDENLSKEAVNIIRRLIDNNQIVANKEATFEFRTHGFYQISNPIWWYKN